MGPETGKQWYKQAGTKVVPEDWQIISIGDHFSFKNGLNKDKIFFGKGTPIVNYMDVLNNPAICVKTIRGKVTVSNEELRAFEVRKGDVLFTRTSETTAEIGMSSVVVEDLTNTVFSGFLLRARPKTNLFELQFKKYCFRSPVVRRQITSTSSKTTRALTNGRLLSNVFVPVPSDPEEQSAIAEALSNNDEFIEQLDQLITKKKNIKKGAMQELLTGKRRLSGFTGKWEVKNFGDVMDGFASGQTPYRAKPEYYKGNIPWITSGELNYNIITDTIEKITPEAVHDTNLKILPKGTFLFAITGLEAEGTRGSCAITGIEATTNQSCMALYPKAGILTTDYLFHYYAEFGKRLALVYCQGTKQQSYTGATAKLLPIVLPPTIEEQSAITQILSDMDAEIRELERRRDKYLMLKKGMMQQLLTGSIRLR